MKYLMFILLFASCKQNLTPEVKQPKPYVYKPSQEVINAENRVYLLLKTMALRDSFRFKEIECVIKNKRSTERRMKDSAEKYNAVIDSIQKSY